MPLHSQQTLLDLEWVVNSPSLINTDEQTPRTLDVSSVDVEKLVRHVEEAHQRKVGRYFESLVEFWLRDLRGLEITVQQMQLFERQRTIGEIDFLYRDEDGAVTHLETAVKFYLHSPEQHRSGSYFIGPNSNDNLEAKHRKLIDHQLKLGQQHFENVQRVEAFVKGRIFYRLDQECLPSLPEMLSPNHLKGNWLYAHEIKLLDQFDASERYCLLRKPHWLAETTFPLSNSTLLKRTELKELVESHFRDSIRPLLVSQLFCKENCWAEYNRFFVVNSLWPNATEA